MKQVIFMVKHQHSTTATKKTSAFNNAFTEKLTKGHYRNLTRGHVMALFQPERDINN